MGGATHSMHSQAHHDKNSSVYGPRVHLPAIIMSASILAYSCTHVHTKHTCTQPGHPAFTLPQSAESLKMLSKRARELKVVHTLNTFLISAFDKSIFCRSPHSVLFPTFQSTLHGELPGKLSTLQLIIKVTCLH